MPRMTPEEIDRALRTPQPTLQDREIVEASAIGNHLRDLRQELEEGHRRQHGERPTKGLLVGIRQKAWDRAHAEIGTAVEAKREFLWSDDPRAVEFRESAWTKAREDFEAKYEKWQGNYLAAIQQQGLKRRDAITDAGLAHFQEAYPGEAISKEDIFYYVYGVLHSEDYRERFAHNLVKELPRIPRVKLAADFWTFSKAGRELAALHVDYEKVEKYPLKIQTKGNLADHDYRVEKMKFAKMRDPETGKNVDDRRTVIYNGRITITDIPLEAWDYVVNGNAALDWVMERQCVKTDKASGIVNDANDWAVDTMENPRYPLELFQRVVTVSMETNRIVAGLPKMAW